MKYAISYILSKQILITPGKYLNIDLLSKYGIGTLILINKILFIRKKYSLILGKPFIENLALFGFVLQKIKGPKILVLKTRPKKNYLKKRGHRQIFTQIFIK